MEDHYGLVGIGMVFAQKVRDPRDGIIYYMCAIVKLRYVVIVS